MEALRKNRDEWKAEALRLRERVEELEAAIIKTLNENAYLADGDVCTLIDLKRAMPTWGLKWPN